MIFRNVFSYPIVLILFCSAVTFLSCEEEKFACETETNINGKRSYFCIDTSVDSGCSSSSTGINQVLHEGLSCADIGYLYQSNSGGFYSKPDDSTQPGEGGAFAGSTVGGGGIAGCDGYKGPSFDIQIDSQCQAAYAYSCSGTQQGVDAACAIYEAYKKDFPNIPDCPYCD